MAKLTDLPLEEAKDWIAAARSQSLANILLVAPNTLADRVRKIVRATQGFLYYVSVTGITGARTELPAELSQGLHGIKQLTNTPVAVGFGISKPAQVSMLSAVTDGIIVGSAIVKLIEAHTIKQDNDLKAGPELVKKVVEFIGELKEATKTGYCSSLKPFFRKPRLTPISLFVCSPVTMRRTFKRPEKFSATAIFLSRTRCSWKQSGFCISPIEGDKSLSSSVFA